MHYIRCVVLGISQAGHVFSEEVVCVTYAVESMHLSSKGRIDNSFRYVAVNVWVVSDFKAKIIFFVVNTCDEFVFLTINSYATKFYMRSVC